jgi:RNA polymerase sigma factor (sigma-70 family)
LLRLQSDERLISLIRRGNTSAFEVLVSRYHARLLAFCRHLLGSREDAEDVLQEVLAASFNAILADDRPINVRPWLYRIARNRSLNHLRRIQAIGVDSMDVHFSENGASTADKVHDREQFRLLVGDIQDLPETQRTALVLREMDALSYEQIAEAMDTTVPGVKSLLVRARISLAEASEARALSCEEVRIELAEVAEGLRKRPAPLVRRHLRTCRRCSSFQGQRKSTNRALAALLPIGPLALLKQLAIIHLGHSAGTSSGAAAGAGAGAGATGAAAGQAACVAGTAGGAALGGAGGVISAGAGAIATKAAGALAAAAIVTAGAVEATHTPVHHAAGATASAQPAAVAPDAAGPPQQTVVPDQHLVVLHPRAARHKLASKASDKTNTQTSTKLATATTKGSTTKTSSAHHATKTQPARVQTQTDPTVLASPSSASSSGTTGASGTPSSSASPAPASSSDGTTGPTGPTAASPPPSTPPASPSSSSTSTTSTTTPTSTDSGSAAPATDPAGTTGPAGPTGAPATDPGLSAGAPSTPNIS